MTFKTPGFDFIFAHREKLEQRLTNTRFRLQRAKDRLEDLMDDPITNAQQRAIGRLEGIIGMREWRETILTSDIKEMTQTLPQDSFTFSNLRENGRITVIDVEATDSPYDDTYVGGTNLKATITGSKYTRWGRRSTRSTVTLIDTFDDETGTTTFGSSKIRKVVDYYDDVTFTLFSESGNQLASFPVI